MKVTGVQLVQSKISNVFNYDVSFIVRTEDFNKRKRLEKLGSNNIIYVALGGDPKIEYTFDSSSDPEIARLTALEDSYEYCTRVEHKGNAVTLYTDFSEIPTDTIVPVSSEWVTPDALYRITSRATPIKIAQLQYEPGDSSIVNVSYGIINTTSTLSTETKKIVYSTGKILVNDIELGAGQNISVNNSITLTAITPGAGVVVIEYTD